jgi:small subunit ribosomal protein S1
MDWTNKNVHPSRVCHLGDEVEVMVLEIDSERRRISLGIKQCMANPWEEFAATHNRNDRITGQIRSITDFGVFIGLDGGIDGLIHLSDLSWDRPGEDITREFKKGDEVTAVVLAVDPDRERISLGIKQAQEDPFGAYVTLNPKGSVVKGVVDTIDAKGAVIRLEDGVDGYLRAADLSRDFVEDARNALQLDTEVEARITSIERKSRRITLSVKALEMEMEGNTVEEYTTRSSTTISLGDKLKEELSKRES